MVIQPGYTSGGAAEGLEVQVGTKASFTASQVSTGGSEFSLSGGGYFGFMVMTVTTDSATSPVYGTSFVCNPLYQLEGFGGLKCVGQNSSSQPVFCKFTYKYTTWKLSFYYLSSGTLKALTIPSGYTVMLGEYPLTVKSS